MGRLTELVEETLAEKVKATKKISDKELRLKIKRHQTYVKHDGKDVSNIKDIQRGVLDNYRLSNKDFSGKDVSGMSFKYADLSNANFTNADVSKANFYGANLKGTDFTGANTKYAVFDKAEMDDTTKL
jgi:uncharacterized protein YjbI with pentapeptide repeats